MRYSVFARGKLFKARYVFKRIFIIENSLNMLPARLNKLGYTAGACRKHAVALFHHKDIIEAIFALFAPAHIFKVAERLALAIHIIRRIARSIK